LNSTPDLKTLCVVVLAVALISVVPASLHGQVTGGTISGNITDATGKMLPNVQIVITNLAMGVSRAVTSNEVGFYSAPNLLPGTYEVKFSAQGFKSEVARGITLTVAAAVSLDQVLRVGSVTETVTVQSESPAVQTSSSDISAVVDATTVRELPLNGRSWTDLAQLQPGVSAIHTQPDFSAGTDRGNRGFGQQLTISGARPQQNNYRLDGVSLNDYANGAPGSVLGGSLGVDAIQEFSVITSNYSAEYGKTSGGVVNAITRSGTNQIHGSGYEFLRNSALDAKNYFDVGNIPPFKRNQFGGTIGGPILKDKTFFFADFEAIRQSLGITTVATVPSEVARSGKLFTFTSCPGTITPDNACQVAANPAAVQYLTFFPHAPASAQVPGSDTAQFTFAGQQIVNENFLTTRVDHNFSNKDSLFGTYMFDRTPYSSPDGLDNVEFETLTARQFLSVEETHIVSPSFANSIRIGGNHEAVNNNESIKAINPDASKTDLGVGGTAFAGRAASSVIISGGGISPFSGGVGGSPTYFYHWNSLQFYDDAFLTKGKHSIRFGGGFERMLLNVVADTDPNGIWIFTDLPSFLTASPKKFQGGIASTLSPRNLRQNIFGVYLQDDWRWKSNVTLNLGLRYEMSSVPSETAGKTANLRNISDPLPVCGKVVPGQCSGSGSFFANPTLKNFEPRVGFAWDVFRNGKTAVRGGIGLFDVLPLPYQFVLMTTQSAPFFSYTAVNDPNAACNCSAFYSGFASSNYAFPANTLRSTYVDSHSRRNYIMQWNLNVQQQLTSTLAGMVAYVGSRGIHQPFKVDEADLVIPTKGPYGYLWPQVDANGNLTTGPNAGNQPLPINPNFGSVRGIFYEGHSYYNALEAQLAKRMSHGLQVQGTFTWGKSMDTSSASVAGDTFGNSISSLHWFDMRLSRGLSDFNVDKTLVVNGTWELPTPKNFSAPAQWALGGWELGLIFTASGGVPFSATWGTGSDPQYTLSSDDWAFPNRLGGSGCGTLTNPGNPNNYVKTQCFAVPTAPNLAFWTANCDPAPPSLGAALAPGDLRCFNLRGNAGRNILIGPGVTSMDFSLYKNNYIRSISEKFNIQFRAEMFNILNHPNFAPPANPTNTDIFDGTGTPNPTAGLLTKTTTTAREVQFAVKVIF
jgi:hypothetical protein